MDSTSSMRYQEEQKSSLTSLPSPKTQTQSNGHNHSHNQILSPRPITSNGHNHSHNQIPSPRPITRSEPGNPYPTTFVQADTNSFKQVVQMLTGSSETAKQASSSTKPNHNHNIPPKKQQGFKLYERRNSFHKNLNINPLLPPIFSNSSFSPRNKQEILSPSILDFPSLALSPVTPLIPDPFNRSGSSSSSAARNGSSLDSLAEDKAIREKGFFLHPSPRASTPRDSEPRLLPLFPTTSPRASGPSSSSKYYAS